MRGLAAFHLVARSQSSASNDSMRLVDWFVLAWVTFSTGSIDDLTGGTDKVRDWREEREKIWLNKGGQPSNSHPIHDLVETRAYNAQAIVMLCRGQVRYN